jgi:hypothetical protein
MYRTSGQHQLTTGMDTVLPIYRDSYESIVNLSEGPYFAEPWLAIGFLLARCELSDGLGLGKT